MSIRYEHMANAVEVRRMQLEQAKASEAMRDALANVESFAGRALLDAPTPYTQPVGSIGQTLGRPPQQHPHNEFLGSLFGRLPR